MSTSQQDPPEELAPSVLAHLDEIRPTMSSGQFALEVLDACLVEEVVPPAWALEEIAECYQAFKTGAPSHGNLQEMLSAPAARTLGEAFGIPDLKRVGAMRTRRQKRLLLPWLVHMFDGPLGLPRTPEGYEIAAAAHGISADQVESWLPKTRKNVRGHKPQRLSEGAHLGSFLAGSPKPGKTRK